MSEEPRIVELQSVTHPSGIITVVEAAREVDFDIKRVYFLHGLDAYSKRGAHGHIQLRQLMIAVTGSFRVTLTGRFGVQEFTLSDPTQGLLIPPMSWRDLDEFSESAVCMVIASALYDEADYVRDFDDFRARLA